MKTITEKAWELVRAMRGRWPELVQQTGVNYHWLAKFSQRKITNPSADIIERLMKFKEKS